MTFDVIVVSIYVLNFKSLSTKASLIVISLDSPKKSS